MATNPARRFVRCILASFLCCTALPLLAQDFPQIQVGLGGIVRYGHVRFANALYMAPDWSTNYQPGWYWHTVYPPHGRHLSHQPESLQGQGFDHARGLRGHQ
jgi:hypothetical protein